MIATILSVSALYIFTDYRSSRRQLFSELRNTAEELTDISRMGLLELAMVGEHPEMLQPALERMASTSSLRQISLLDMHGVVRFSSRPSDLGREFSREEEGCRNCHMGASGQLDSSVFFEQGGRQILRHVSLVPNRIECHRCHDPAQENNGIMIADFSTAEISGRLSAQLRETVYRAGLTAFLTLIVLGLLMNKLVIIRLRKLTEAATRTTRTAEFSALNQVGGADEIGQLARSFEAMTSRVRSSLRTLQDQQAYLQKLINSLPDGLVVVGRDHRPEMINRAAGDLWSSSELAAILAADNRDSEAASCLQKTFRTGAATGCELRPAAEGDGPRFLEVLCSPVRDEEGKIIRAILLMRDVTQRKAFEAQAGRAERLAGVGRLAAGLAHEINNPMAAITTCVEGLSRHVERSQGIEAPEKQEIRDYLATVGEAAHRCKEITQRLLTASVDRDAGSFEPVNLLEVVNDTICLVEHQAQRQGVEISTEEPSRPAVILGNRRKISQLLLNLLLNSLEALPEGGAVVVSLSRMDDFVHLQVSDTGSGIPEENLEHIFDPFFTTKTEGRGTGLGLSVSQWIVRQHQGRIEVRSRPKEGASFSILFPACDRGTA